MEHVQRHRRHRFRKNKMTIVFTNGCFDLVHAGHVDFLRRARALGDQLIVGVNSDSSVRRLKGDSRPINCLRDRMAVLQAIRWVDAVLLFNEDTPVNLVKQLRPDILVKGPGYCVEIMPEAHAAAAWGASVVILDGPDISTTKIIEKLSK